MTQLGKAKKKKRTKNQTKGSKKVVSIAQRGVAPDQQLGAFSRNYPNREARQKIIDRVSSKSEEKRSGNDWWQLGEYLIVDGLIDGDDTVVNDGTAALMRGADLDPPHLGCLMDLGWILVFKGMDSMAKPYLEKAALTEPTSRDIQCLNGWACIGSGDRENALQAFREACKSKYSTDADHRALERLENGDELRDIRRELVLNKLDTEAIGSNELSSKENAAVLLVPLKQLNNQNPDDAGTAYHLAYCYYVLEQYQRAQPLLIQVVDDDEVGSEACTLLGLIAKKQGETEDMASWYRKALVADRSNVLAATNLASHLQDIGQYYEARPLLINALENSEEDNPHRAIALDLMGSNVGVIDHDYEQEVELHRQAIALKPAEAIFHSNLVVSLLAAGREKDAQTALDNASRKSIHLPNESLVRPLVKLFRSKDLHPFEYMEAINHLSETMGWPALKPLVENAWRNRNRISESDLRAVREEVSGSGSEVPNPLISIYSDIAMTATASGNRELAVRIWRECSELPGGSVCTPNIAADLSQLERHAEALEAAEAMSMETPRSWTILGNVRMHAGLYAKALEAYEEALDKDEPFLLPISNAIDAAQQGYLSEKLGPFIDRLLTDWNDDVFAYLLLGTAYGLQGRLRTAAECYRKALWSDDGAVRLPDELWAKRSVNADLSIFGGPSLQYHYAAAQCLMSLGQHDDLFQIVRAIQGSPKWSNGDWLVFEAEAFLLEGKLSDAEAVVKDMPDQAPPLIVRTEIALARKQDEYADSLIQRGIDQPEAEKMSYPFGRPDAVLLSLGSSRALVNGNTTRASEFATEAVRRDPACVRARLAASEVAIADGAIDDAISMLEDGLRRAPGHPDLISLLIELLVSSGQRGKAEDWLEANCSLLQERNAEKVAFQLGEMLALEKLAMQSDGYSEAELAPQVWDWVEEHEQPIKGWLTAASLALGRGEQLAAAYGLYLFKTAEYILVRRLMEPFKSSLDGTRVNSYNKRDDVLRYINGGVPPSIGAIARVLFFASKPYRSNEDETTTLLRDFINQSGVVDRQILRDEKFAQALRDLGYARNKNAHTGNLSLQEILESTRAVVVDGKPGRIFSAFGLELRS